MHETMLSSALATFNIGHMLNLEDPQQFNTALIVFFRERTVRGMDDGAQSNGEPRVNIKRIFINECIDALRPLAVTCPQHG
jgi:hypothetical protein